MSEMKYPGFITQKSEHDKLLSKVKQYQAELQSGKLALSIEVMRFLKDWLVSHIMGSDKKYSSFFNAAGVK